MIKMINIIVNKLRKYNLYDKKLFKLIKVTILKFKGRYMKRYGVSCLELIDKCMLKANIDYWVDFGTLLGIYRDNNFIKHDFDIDIGIKKSSYKKELEDIFTNSGMKKIREYYAYDELVEQTWIWNGVYIDLFMYVKENDKLFSYEFYTKGEAKITKVNKKVSICDNLQARIFYIPDINVKRIKFKNIEISAPENIDEYLILNYGENYKVPDKLWDSSKADNVKELEKISMKEYLYK